MLLTCWEENDQINRLLWIVSYAVLFTKSVCLGINMLSVDHPKTGRNIENKEIMLQNSRDNPWGYSFFLTVSWWAKVQGLLAHYKTIFV